MAAVDIKIDILQKEYDSFWDQAAGVLVRGRVVSGDRRYVGLEGSFPLAEYQREFAFFSMSYPLNLFGFSGDRKSFIPDRLVCHPYKKNGEVSKICVVVEVDEVLWDG